MQQVTCARLQTRDLDNTYWSMTYTNQRSQTLLYSIPQASNIVHTTKTRQANQPETKTTTWNKYMGHSIHPTQSQNGPVKTKFLCANTLNNIGPTKHFSSLLTIWRLMASNKFTVPIVPAFLMRCSTHRRSSVSGQIFGTAESEPLCLSVKQVVLGLLRKSRRWGNFIVFARRLVYMAASSFACTTVAT